MKKNIIPKKRYYYFFIMILIFLFPGLSNAWKSKAHVFLAEQVLNEVLKNNGKVSFYNQQTGKLVATYRISNQNLNALRRYPMQYRAGAIGPDGYPDLVTGQTQIHPGTDGAVGTHKWILYLWNLSKRSSGADRAFVLGYLAHAAGDLFGHTFINHFAGGSFKFGKNAAKHIVVESYIEKCLPVIKDAYNRTVSTSKISIRGVENFIYQHLVKATPGSWLDNFIKAKFKEFSVPKTYSYLRYRLQRSVNEYKNKIKYYNKKINYHKKKAKKCKLSNFRCSKAKEYAKAAKWGVKKKAYQVRYGPGKIYKERWIKDIDRGLKAWPGFNHRLAMAFYNSDMRNAKKLASNYMKRHLMSMSGLPDAIGKLAILNSKIMNALTPKFIRNAIDKMKTKFFDFILKKTWGMTTAQLKDYFKKPHQNFPRLGLNLKDFNKNEMKISRNYQTINYKNIPSMVNTVTMIKLTLLTKNQINDLLKDKLKYRVSKLSAENVMLGGWQMSLDASNQWNANPRKMVFAKEMNKFSLLFLPQTGANYGTKIIKSKKTRLNSR